MAVAVVFLDFGAADPIGLPRQSHHAADLMQFLAAFSTGC
jgi:hypothetical protein